MPKLIDVFLINRPRSVQTKGAEMRTIAAGLFVLSLMLCGCDGDRNGEEGFYKRQYNKEHASHTEIRWTCGKCLHSLPLTKRHSDEGKPQDACPNCKASDWKLLWWDVLNNEKLNPGNHGSPGEHFIWPTDANQPDGKTATRDKEDID